MSETRDDVMLNLSKSFYWEVTRNGEMVNISVIESDGQRERLLFNIDLRTQGAIALGDAIRNAGLSILKKGGDEMVKAKKAKGKGKAKPKGKVVK